MKLAALIQRELADPRTSGVHITRVEMTTDLSRASVFYRPTPGAASLEDVEQGLRAAAGFLRRGLARTLRLRHVPELRFSLDELPDRGLRMEEILGAQAGVATVGGASDDGGEKSSDWPGDDDEE